MSKSAPIAVFGVPALVKPRVEMPITLFRDEREGTINWNRGEWITKAQLEAVIDRSRGQRLPNDVLPALDPGDVVVLVDGVFYIDRDWNLQPCELAVS